MLTIKTVTADELAVLVPLVRVYCEFNGEPSDASLASMAQVSGSRTASARSDRRGSPTSSTARRTLPETKV